MAVREDRALVLKPENVTFEEAAAVPVAAITALQALRDKGTVQPGQKVLVNGASGGVGTFAVQIAKFSGLLAELNPEDLRELGELLAAGELKPVIDQRYPLREVPAAIAYLEEGRARGKVVIDVQ